MPNWLYNTQRDLLEWWHVHPVLWTIALVVAVVATLGAQMTRK